MFLKEYIKDFQVSEDCIEIVIEVPLIEEKGKKVRINDKNVLSFLLGSNDLLTEKQKKQIEKCIFSSIVSNLHKHSLRGKWIFSLTIEENKDKLETNFSSKKKKKPHDSTFPEDPNTN